MTEDFLVHGRAALETDFGKERVSRTIEAVKQFEVEIPSWVFGPFGGGRFGDYMPPGAARNIEEKLDDAAFVHQLTGATPQVAMHMLWDFSKDQYTASESLAKDVSQLAGERGLKIGSISPTYFLKGSERNSYAAMEQDTAERYIDQTVLAAEIAQKYGVGLITLWFPDGSNYPAQVELRLSYENMRDNLLKTADRIDHRVWVLIEYKVFEPGTYSTTIPDWGTAFALAKAFGDNAGVLVDLGHHFHGANIQQIVARLIAEDLRCGFHFNTRYAADDDHAVEPNAEMARIFYELVSGDVIQSQNPERNWAYMIDQACGRENRIHSILHSVDSLQHCLARAMLVKTEDMLVHQREDEIILANRMFNDALVYADVRPLVAAARLEKNLPIDPLKAFVESGYQTKIENQR